MIVRAAVLGFVAWLAATLFLHFYGASIFHPGEHILLFVVTPPVLVAATWVAMRLLRVQRGDEAEAAIALALPGMALDAYGVFDFPTVFPNLDPTLDGVFGAWMLAGYASVAFAGLLFTKLQPEDERL